MKSNIWIWLFSISYLEYLCLFLPYGSCNHSFMWCFILQKIYCRINLLDCVSTIAIMSYFGFVRRTRLSYKGKLKCIQFYFHVLKIFPTFLKFLMCVTSIFIFFPCPLKTLADLFLSTIFFFDLGLTCPYYNDHQISSYVIIWMLHNSCDLRLLIIFDNSKDNVKENGDEK